VLIEVQDILKLKIVNSITNILNRTAIILFANLRGSKNVTPADPQFYMFGILNEHES